MSAVVVLEWNFSPPDYFEEPIEISRHDYTMIIADGNVQAKIESPVYEADPSMRQRLHDVLNDWFLGVQLLSHRAYQLSKPKMTRVHPDGRRDLFLEPETGRFDYFGSAVDFRVADRHGNVISDSRQDRIEKEKTLAELVARYRSTDCTLDSLLRSHDAAVHDANNGLV